MAFSTTLTQDLTSTDEIMHVASNVGARTTYPWRLKIDDEALAVTAGVEEGLDWTVLRGQDDTDPADHPSGTLALAAPLGSVGPVRSVTRTLTSAELLALFTTPITLVAGQAGKAIVPFGAIFLYHFGTVAYPANADLFMLGWDGTSAITPGLEAGTDIWFGGAVVDGVFFQFYSSGNGAVSEIDGADLIVTFGTQDQIDGDGTLDLTVLYREVDVS